MLLRRFQSLSKSLLSKRFNHGQSNGNGGLPTHFTLNSSSKIPSIALGVRRTSRSSTEERVSTAVKTALNAGYRHIDCSWIGRWHEEEAARGMEESGVARDQIWVTSKLLHAFPAPEEVESILDGTLARLGTDYVDLYLTYWPLKPLRRSNSKNPSDNQVQHQYLIWKKMEELVAKGKIRNLGVSGCTIEQIDELRSKPLKIAPAVLQVQMNYRFPQTELLQWSKNTGILLQASHPLRRHPGVVKSIGDSHVERVAKELGMTPAQVILSWHVQRGTIVAPRTGSASHIEANIHIAKLPDEAFAELERAAIAHSELLEGGMSPSKE